MVATLDYVNQDSLNNLNGASSFSEHCDSVGLSTLKKHAGIAQILYYYMPFEIYFFF